MEGFLPLQWSILWSIVFIPFFLIGVKNVNKIIKDEPKKKVLLALCGAFVFVLSALKIPSLTGSCSHPTGVGLGAILFGPSVMDCLFRFLKKKNVKIETNVFISAALGDLCTYIVTAIQLGVAFPDATGGIMLSIGKFMGVFFMTQIPIAIAEGILTTVIYNLISSKEDIGGENDEYECQINE